MRNRPDPDASCEGRPWRRQTAVGAGGVALAFATIALVCMVSQDGRAAGLLERDELTPLQRQQLREVDAAEYDVRIKIANSKYEKALVQLGEHVPKADTTSIHPLPHLSIPRKVDEKTPSTHQSLARVKALQHVQRKASQATGAPGSTVQKVAQSPVLQPLARSILHRIALAKHADQSLEPEKNEQTGVIDNSADRSLEPKKNEQTRVIDNAAESYKKAVEEATKVAAEPFSHKAIGSAPKLAVQAKVQELARSLSAKAIALEKPRVDGTVLEKGSGDEHWRELQHHAPVTVHTEARFVPHDAKDVHAGEQTVERVAKVQHAVKQAQHSVDMTSTSSEQHEPSLSVPSPSVHASSVAAALLPKTSDAHRDARPATSTVQSKHASPVPPVSAPAAAAKTLPDRSTLPAPAAAPAQQQQAAAKAELASPSSKPQRGADAGARMQLEHPAVGSQSLAVDPRPAARAPARRSRAPPTASAAPAPAPESDPATSQQHADPRGARAASSSAKPHASVSVTAPSSQQPPTMAVLAASDPAASDPAPSVAASVHAAHASTAAKGHASTVKGQAAEAKGQAAGAKGQAAGAKGQALGVKGNGAVRAAGEAHGVAASGGDGGGGIIDPLAVIDGAIKAEDTRGGTPAEGGTEESAAAASSDGGQAEETAAAGASDRAVSADGEINPLGEITDAIKSDDARGKRTRAARASSTSGGAAAEGGGKSAKAAGAKEAEAARRRKEINPLKVIDAAYAKEQSAQSALASTQGTQPGAAGAAHKGASAGRTQHARASSVPTTAAGSAPQQPAAQRSKAAARQPAAAAPAAQEEENPLDIISQALSKDAAEDKLHPRARAKPAKPAAKDEKRGSLDRVFGTAIAKKVAAMFHKMKRSPAAAAIEKQAASTTATAAEDVAPEHHKGLALKGAGAVKAGSGPAGKQKVEVKGDKRDYGLLGKVEGKDGGLLEGAEDQQALNDLHKLEHMGLLSNKASGDGGGAVGALQPLPKSVYKVPHWYSTRR